LCVCAVWDVTAWSFAVAALTITYHILSETSTLDWESAAARTQRIHRMPAVTLKMPAPAIVLTVLQKGAVTLVLRELPPPGALPAVGTLLKPSSLLAWRSKLAATAVVVL
jgi:hypothetical protein